MGTVTARNGDQLVLYRPGVSALDDYPDLPLIFACVVARHQGGVIFVFNSWRQEWELPAGLIEPGETATEAAVRELYEESGQRAASISRHTGIALLHLSDGTLEMGAMFSAELDAFQPFMPNREESSLMVWDLQPPQPIEGYVNELSIALAEMVQ